MCWAPLPSTCSGDMLNSAVEAIITQVEHDEGNGAVTADPTDKGGLTAYGISKASNPEAWADGVVTEEEARAIYERKYVTAPHFDLLPAILQPLCIDWGVVSGPQLVIGELQGLLDLSVDHRLGPATLKALPLTPEALLKLNNLLVAARVKQVGRIVSKNPSQVKYVSGWLNRALEFLL